jgi:hypothetical protein
MFIAFLAEGIGIWLLYPNASEPLLFVLLSGVVFFAWGEIYSLFPATCTDIYGRTFATTNYGLLYTAGSVIPRIDTGIPPTLKSLAIGASCAVAISPPAPTMVPKTRLAQLESGHLDQMCQVFRNSTINPSLRTRESRGRQSAW